MGVRVCMRYGWLLALTECMSHPPIHPTLRRPSQRHGLHLCDLKPHDLSSELLLLAEEYEAQLGEAGHLVQEAEAEKQEAEAEMVR